jgi:hypothetical protein
MDQEMIRAMQRQIRVLFPELASLHRHHRKANARETKRQAIERRQVARAVRGIEWAPPLLRNGKAPR